jgi:CBS domain containing-hemolysin-like protein
VYGEQHDDITGFVLKTDLLLAQANDRGDAPLSAFRRNIVTVPVTAPLSRLFETLIDQRAHIAHVVDEYGGAAGLVTLEDVVETLLGMEIVDEADRADDMQALARTQWEKRARQLGLLDSSEPPPPHEPG